MNTDVVIIGAGPAGIFTAIEMLRRGSKMCIRDRTRAFQTTAFPA